MKWACDLIDDNLKKVSREYPHIQVTKNISFVLEDPEVDLIAIATQPETHFRLGNLVLDAGKHLWIEKPFTTSLGEAKKLLEKAKQRKKYLHVDLPFIFYGPVVKIKELLEKRVIGKPLYFTSSRTNLGLIQRKIDVVWDLAPHDLSIIFYLFPDLKVKKVGIHGSSPVGQGKKHQIANLVIEFNRNFTAYIHLSWLSPAKIRLITIGGKRKMILFDDIHPTEKIKIYDKNVTIKRSEITPFVPVYRSGDVLMPVFSQQEALANEINFLYEQLVTSHKQYYTAEIGLKILDIMEKVSLKA